MLFVIRENRLSVSHRNFPTIGIFFIVEKPSGEWLYCEMDEKKGLPFEPFVGGKSWQDMVKEFAARWGIEPQQGELVGIGSANQTGRGSETYCVFRFMGVPPRLPSSHGWAHPESTLEWDSISLKIKENTARSQGSVWND